MSESKRRESIAKAVEEITKTATDAGLIIEAGWLGLRAIAISKEAPPAQLKELRMAFFAGAQHLWGSINSVLDPGEGPTEKDLERMERIDTELRGFLATFKREHGL